MASLVSAVLLLRKFSIRIANVPRWCLFRDTSRHWIVAIRTSYWWRCSLLTSSTMASRGLLECGSRYSARRLSATANTSLSSHHSTQRPFIWLVSKNLSGFVFGYFAHIVMLVGYMLRSWCHWQYCHELNVKFDFIRNIWTSRKWNPVKALHLSTVALRKI